MKKEESMSKKNILVVSNPGTMKPDLMEWISNEDKFDMTFADTHEQAIELSNQQLFDLVLIDKTDENVNVRKLGAIIPIFNAETLFVGYEGEGRNEIEEKIKLAFDYRKYKRMQRMMILDSSTRQKGNGVAPF